MQWESDVSMRLTKSEGGRRVTPSFSGVVKVGIRAWKLGSWNVDDDANDPVDDRVVKGMAYILGLGFLV